MGTNRHKAQMGLIAGFQNAEHATGLPSVPSPTVDQNLAIREAWRIGSSIP